MPKTVQQSVRFKASPERLFDIYMDSRKHSAATNAKAKLSRSVGGRFTAHNGYIRGKNLAIVRNRMMVQSWRGRDWKKTDMDSVLMLVFRRVPAGRGRIDMVHANVPDRWYSLIKRGWNEYYWKPWKAYLRKSKKKRR